MGPGSLEEALILIEHLAGVYAGLGVVHAKHVESCWTLVQLGSHDVTRVGNAARALLAGCSQAKTIGLGGVVGAFLPLLAEDDRGSNWAKNNILLLQTIYKAFCFDFVKYYIMVFLY